METREVEKWLQGLGTLIPKEALAALTEEVRRNQMDGSEFARLVASRTMPKLGDVVKPSHMATLRRCWNSNPTIQATLAHVPTPSAGSSVCGESFEPQAAATPQRRVFTEERRKRQQTAAIPEKSPVTSSSTALRDRDAYLKWSARYPEQAFANGSPTNLLEVTNKSATAAPVHAPGRSLHRSWSAAPGSRLAPPPRHSATEGVDSDHSDAASPDDASPFQRGHASNSPGMANSEASRADSFQRPPQVPRLDLTSIHRNADYRAENATLIKNHTWMAGNQPGIAKSLMGGAPPGFASASAEDQQRIADFYGYRDEGFIATMHGLRTDMIRPRLYIGTMADAAYQPLLDSIGISYVLNCAIEAQKVPPPYESRGIKYLLLPLQDSVDQAQLLMRQRYGALRQATKFLHNALKGNSSTKGSVLVHCVQGLSRSAAIICAYLMEYEGLTLDRALVEVKTKHPGCLTSQHWQAFLHKYNAELLRGF